MIINIAIPEGKMVSFADNIDRWHATVKDDQNYDDTNFANTTWTAKNGKVVCLKGENHSNSDGEDKVEVTNTKADVAHNKQASTTIKITTKKEKSNKDDND